MAYGYNLNPYYQPQIMTPTQQNTGIIWVQGENAAKAYPVSAGQSILLMDSEDSIMYIKSTDQSGMPHLRVFEYKERIGTHKDTPQTTEYISREEFNKFREEIKDEFRRRKQPENVKESKNA